VTDFGCSEVQFLAATSAPAYLIISAVFHLFVINFSTKPIKVYKATFCTPGSKHKSVQFIFLMACQLINKLDVDINSLGEQNSIAVNHVMSWQLRN